MAAHDESAASAATTLAPTAVALEKSKDHEDAMQSPTQDTTGTHVTPESEKKDAPDAQETRDAQGAEKSETPADEAALDAEPEAEQEYPPFWKLVLLTIALCMAIFLTSLVSLSRHCDPEPY